MRTVEGSCLRAGRRAITPLAMTLILRCGRGYYIHSRPYAVVVEEEGRTSRVRVTDMTRLVQAAIMVGAVVCACGLLARTHVRKEKKP
jgi:hypothetical protein